MKEGKIRFMSHKMEIFYWLGLAVLPIVEIFFLLKIEISNLQNEIAFFMNSTCLLNQSSLKR